MPRFSFLLALIALLLCAAACSRPGEDGDSTEESEAKGERRPPLVRVVNPDRGSLADRLEVTARVVAFERAPIIPRREGVVVELFHREGDEVEAGAALARIEDDQPRLERDSAELALKQALLNVTQAKLTLDETRAQARGESVTLANEIAKLARAKQQHAERVISDQDLEAAQYNHDSALARKEQSDVTIRKLEEDVKVKELMAADARGQLAKAELQVAWCTVRATIPGVITQRMIDVGQRAVPGTAVFEIENLDSLVIEPSVPEKEIQLLKVGLDVALRCTAWPGESFDGKVEYVARRVDPEGGKITTRIRLQSRDEHPLLPGMFVSGHIITREKPDILLIPKKALLFERDRPYVWVLVRGAAPGSGTSGAKPGAARGDALDRYRRPSVRKVFFEKGLEDPEVVEYIALDDERRPLSIEDEIVLVGLDRLADGVEVRVEGEAEAPFTSKADSAAKKSTPKKTKYKADEGR
jgi:multidrug efflux pump subunit AcrA (membrane-fusion protein)